MAPDEEKGVRNRKTTFLHQCGRCGSGHFIRPTLSAPCSVGFKAAQLDSSVLDDPLFFDSAVGESS